MEKTGIYIHFPFCLRKCNYCDFLSFPAEGEERERYVTCLVREIRRGGQHFSKRRTADTVFFGGGTPSLLTPPQMERIFEALHETFSIEDSAEITMECNPGTADKEKICGFHKMGGNRISVGVQSAVDSELECLGRIHRFEEAKNTVRTAREAGFQNINIDLMSAIPGQTLESYEDTLEQILVLKPEHISAYSLIIEEGTPFYKKYKDNPPVDEETDRLMYAVTKERLADGGYERYEISNYAKKGYECRHNLKYWSGEDYIGFGLGASSKIGNVRYQNERSMEVYIRNIEQKKPVSYVEEVLEREDEMAEFFILGLRRTRGISLEQFEDRFGVSAEAIYGKQIETFIRDGLLAKKQNQLFFTDYGLDVSNVVLCEFL